jgi:transglutaminase-like putative cysteine protease
VAHGLQRVRLVPKATQGQQILDWAMDYEGATQQLRYEDQNHNTTTLISVDEGTEKVIVTCRGTVDTEDQAGVIGKHSGHLPLWSFIGQTDLTRPGARMRELVNKVRGEDGMLEMLHRLSSAVLEDVEYRIGSTQVDTTAEEALSNGSGVCQDHAHIFIGAARRLGAPARYVSGYLMMDDRVDQDATHAWAEAHVDGLGWVGFDISNGISPDARYVRVATGRDYRDAAPITGISYGGQEQTLHVDLAVEQQTAEQ